MICHYLWFINGSPSAFAVLNCWQSQPRKILVCLMLMALLVSWQISAVKPGSTMDPGNIGGHIRYIQSSKALQIEIVFES